MSKLFYTDNGSTAIEVALKMALQYWFNKDPQTKKSKVICFKHSYHGDTFGAMSAAGRNQFNKPFWKHLFEVN
jgi:adenosylmethionine---8-amino-7-oxononanoate aminotransferase